VRLAVRRLLADPGYAERARAIRDWCAAHDGAAAAADELESVIQR
jgi:UDP:flavonoid glycosyltransferase YjiC (YdhE family)